MLSIVKLIVGAILQFVWSRAKDWYREELKYQQVKKVLIQEAKNAAREVASQNSTIAGDIESIDDSLLRLERHAGSQPESSGFVNPEGGIFAAYLRNREAGDSAGDSRELSEIPLSDSRSNPSNSTSERSSTESLGSASYRAL